MMEVDPTNAPAAGGDQDRRPDHGEAVHEEAVVKREARVCPHVKCPDVVEAGKVHVAVAAHMAAQRASAGPDASAARPSVAAAANAMMLLRNMALSFPSGFGIGRILAADIQPNQISDDPRASALNPV